MTLPTIGGGQHSSRVFSMSECCDDGQSSPSAAGDQMLQCLKFAVQRRWLRGGIGVCSVIDEQIDQRNLHTALACDASRRDQHQGFVQRRMLNAGIEDDFCNALNVFRKLAAANGILCDELDQRRVPKVVTAFEDHTLAYKVRVRL